MALSPFNENYLVAALNKWESFNIRIIVIEISTGALAEYYNPTTSIYC